MGTVQKDEDQPVLWPGLEDLGSSSREEFFHHLQTHRAILGLGWPVQASTPLEALCVGTPFINREFDDQHHSHVIFFISGIPLACSPILVMGLWVGWMDEKKISIPGWLMIG